MITVNYASSQNRPAGTPKSRLPEQKVRTQTISTRFNKLEEIARGGTGVIYSAVDPSRGNRRVVVKAALSPNFNGMIEEEAHTVFHFDRHRSESLPEFFDHGLDPDHGVYWLAMPYVDGELISKMGQFPLSKALPTIKQIAQGLAVAADIGIYHRDMKPENVIIDKSGQAKILDFGLSKTEEEAGAIRGTIGYMAPEQISGGKKLDHRTDIYALGIMFYEMINGSNPFQSFMDRTVVDIKLFLEYKAALEENLPPIRLVSLDRQVLSLTQAFVDKMAAPRQEDRFQTYEELIDAATEIEQRMAAFTKETQHKHKALLASAEQEILDLERAPTLVDLNKLLD